MKIRVVCIGKTRNPHLAALGQDYLERTRRFTPCEQRVLKEDSRGSRRTTLTRAEEKRVLEELAGSPHSILLDVGGRDLDSAAFADMLEKHRMRGTRQVDFFLAGPWGWTDKIRAQATERLTLSRMTLPHELARLVLLEQLFRAMARLHGVPYEK